MRPTETRGTPRRLGRIVTLRARIRAPFQPGATRATTTKPRGSLRFPQNVAALAMTMWGFLDS